MKKIFCLAVFVAAFLLSFAQVEQCPMGGRENCTGYCGAFNDNNGDGFCDFSIIKKEEAKAQSSKKETTSEKRENNKIERRDTETKPSFSEIESSIAEAETESITQEISTFTDTTPIVKQKLSGYKKHFWPICITTLVLYALSSLLVWKKKIKKVNHRRLWNCILLITCLVSCLLGFYVAIAKIYGWSFDYMSIMVHHVDFGVSMTIICIIHILWHLKYFKNIISNAKQ